MRALLSVYDKTGLEALARGLAGLGVELVASGGTSTALAAAGIEHRQVEDVTGAPEMLSGRVKTLHPRIHAGILADLDEPTHREDLAREGIEPIGLVVSNLYPFRSTPSIEMIDIGGPTMVRAAAKNHAHVAVIVDPSDYGAVLDELRREGQITAGTRRRLARAAFAHTAAYDAAIVRWLDSSESQAGRAPAIDALPLTLHLALERCQELRYGENPHQAGARYRDLGASRGWWDSAVQHGGRELSYLNVFDADAAWRLVHEVRALAGAGAGAGAAAVVVKHASPCGVAVGSSTAEAYGKAFAADPLSAFGGIVALDSPVDAELAEQIVANPLADVLVAPSFDEAALALFAGRRKNMRTLAAAEPGDLGLMLRQVDGGYLVQEPDRLLAGRDEWRVVTDRVPTAEQWRDAELAWLVCARTSSNAIVLAHGGVALGIGCGQPSRVDAAGIAARKAAGRAEGGAGASDAFFPFRDGLDAVADAGIAVVVQPGGSLRDDEVVAAANERGVAMIVTGERHFRH
jgi:phosphoribosylaminoimidazolecarboxamide formyltransferase/IMP cyclohydrolase